MPEGGTQGPFASSDWFLYFLTERRMDDHRHQGAALET